MGSKKNPISSFDDLYETDYNDLLNEKSVFRKDECKMCSIRFYCGGPCEDWKEKLMISDFNTANSIECSLNFLILEECVFLISEIINKFPRLLQTYAKEKRIEYRLNYPLDFNKFVLFFS
jgi:radical SAM protein with 4Fe4S-binding SPASM domain